MNAPVSVPTKAHKLRRDDLCLCTTISRDGLEYDVVIWFDIATFSPGLPECRYQRNGDPGWPAEPAEYEFRIIGIEGDGDTGPLTAEECETLAAWFDDNNARACEVADENAPDREAERADYEYDRYRDEQMERNWAD